MKICLVTAFPPSRRGPERIWLSHRAGVAARSTSESHHSGRRIEDCTRRRTRRLRCGSLLAIRLACRIRCDWRRSFTTSSPMSCGSTCCSPPSATSRCRRFWVWVSQCLSRLTGHYTHVTLHHLMDNIDLADSGVRFPRFYRAAGSTATRMLLMANSISVLLPAYRRTLIDKYRGENVHFRAHGILGGCPEPPDFDSRGNPEHRILAFGKWGTYKRLDLLLEAFQQLVVTDAKCAADRGGSQPSSDTRLCRIRCREQ